MYDERELTVEQIGAVLGVSRTSIYRALGKGTPPAPSAPAAPAPARMAEPVAAAQGTAAQGTAAQGTAGGAAALASGVPAPVGGAQVVVRSRGRSRWFVVEADPADPEHGPVAVWPYQPDGGEDCAGPGQEQGVVGRGGGGAAAGPCRGGDQLSAGVGQPGRAGRRAARAAAVSGWLCAVRRNRWRWV